MCVSVHVCVRVPETWCSSHWPVSKRCGCACVNVCLPGCLSVTHMRAEPFSIQEFLKVSPTPTHVLTSSLTPKSSKCPFRRTPEETRWTSYRTAKPPHPSQPRILQIFLRKRQSDSNFAIGLPSPWGLGYLGQLLVAA